MRKPAQTYAIPYAHNLTLWQLASIFLLAALALFIAVEPAFAAADGTVGNFSCSSTGQANGTLYDAGSVCPTTLSFSNIFSFLVCNIEHLSSNLMGHMFCGMVTNLAPAVSAVIVLATVIFGLGFTIGIIPATARDFQMFLLKVSFIWAFATQSDYLIGYVYTFFISGIRDGVGMVLTGFNPSGVANTANDAFAQLDGFFAKMIQFATDYIGGSATSTGNECKNALFAVLAIMAIAFPPIFFVALALIMKLSITFVRAVFGYIYALVGITFLLTLAPIFLSFFLFKPTRSFFDKWTGYLASFALQIVILFAFLSFILSINVSHISNSFVDLVVPVKKTIESGSFRAPWEYCTLCDFKVVDKDTGIELTAAEQKEFIKKGKMVCKTNPGTPIDALAATTPQANGSTTTKEQSAILRFAGAGFTTLLVLAFVIEALLGSVASLAQVIASGVGGGVSMAPQLGGGVSMSGRPTVGMPGDGLYGDFEAGMTRGFGQSNNSVGGFTGGFKEGAAQMLTGRSGSGQEISGSGVKNRFLDWLVDPSQMDRY